MAGGSAVFPLLSLARTKTALRFWLGKAALFFAESAAIFRDVKLLQRPAGLASQKAATKRKQVR
jgi:hypothetical protein